MTEQEKNKIKDELKYASTRMTNFYHDLAMNAYKGIKEKECFMDGKLMGYIEATGMAFKIIDKVYKEGA